MSRRAKIRLLTATILLVGMLPALVPTVTGIPAHEWIGLFVTIPLLAHIIIDWKWIKVVTMRFFKKQPGQTRFNYLWDWFMFALVTVGVFSGLLVSESALPLLGISLQIDSFWIGIHVLSCKLLMLVFGIHMGMHGDWVVNAFRHKGVKKSSRSDGERHDIDAFALVSSNRVLLPVAIILISATCIALATLPFADASWAENFRYAVDEGLAADQARLGDRTFGDTLVQDFPWVLAFLGIPALIAYSAKRILGSLAKNN